MYIPQIKEKHSLVDLARYGTRSRKNIHPDVLIGLHPCPPIYKEGDLLDANAVLDLIKNIHGQGKIYESLEAQMKQTKDQLQEKIDSVSNREDQLENTVAELEQKHDQDIQDVKQYVVEEIDKAKATVVYDRDDESLLIYNVKHE